MIHVVAKDLKKGDIICFKDWRNDLQVFDIVISEDDTTMVALCKSFDGDIEERIYKFDELIMVVRQQILNFNKR